MYPVRYQWARVAKAAGVAGRAHRRREALDAPLALALAIALSYPFVLLALGFYLPAERARLRALYRPRSRIAPS